MTHFIFITIQHAINLIYTSNKTVIKAKKRSKTGIEFIRKNQNLFAMSRKEHLTNMSNKALLINRIFLTVLILILFVGGVMVVLNILYFIPNENGQSKAETQSSV